MKLPEPYEELRDVICTTTDGILYHRHPGSTFNVFDEGKDEHGNFVGKAATPEHEEVFEEQMMAFMKKMGFKTGNRNGAGGGNRAAAGGGSGGGNPKGQPRGDQGRKCVNCGSLDHISSACTKPELPRDKRPCWKCGIPGHLGRDCRKGAANMVDEGGGDGGGNEMAAAFLNMFGCVQEREDGWQVMGKNNVPVPSVPTFGDYLRASKRRAVAAKFLGSSHSDAQCTSHCCSRDGKLESVTLSNK